MHSCTHTLSHSLTHTYMYTHSSTNIIYTHSHSVMHVHMHSLTRTLTHSPTHPPTHPLTHSHTHMYSFFPHLHTNSLDSTLFHLSASIISLSLSLSAQFVLKMMSGWSMVSLLTRVVLRCAGMEYGAQCVVTCGNQLMPEWCVSEGRMSTYVCVSG